jgi:lipopolysaccharide transport system ATP-binding protein
MYMHPIIKIENLSKMYRLGVIGTGTLTHDLKRWYYGVRGWEDPYLKIGETNVRSSKGNSEYVWALKDINLEIEQGEVLGIIGKNGAGKSTLLKILSKVTGPTTGRISYNGRIGSLLEVGTGFHMELTGRENIFLNGAILGMTKREIKGKLDEIIDFSGTDRYIDTPVKRYSSGMMVRLGFAVAAHLEPEILVVDEVLAVGDVEFQKKAVGKMKDVSRNDGRTVLFVSHNMAAVQTLCTTAVLIEDGMLSFKGSATEVVTKYLQSNYNISQKPIYQRSDRKGAGQIKFESLTLKDKSGKQLLYGTTGDDLYFQLKFKIPNSKITHAVPLEIGIIIRDQQGTIITTLASFFTNESPKGVENNSEITCSVTKLPLLAGQYNIDLWCATSSEMQDFLENASVLQIEAGNYFNSSHAWQPRADRHGKIIIDQKWYNT